MCVDVCVCVLAHHNMWTACVDIPVLSVCTQCVLIAQCARCERSACVCELNVWCAQAYVSGQLYNVVWARSEYRGGLARCLSRLPCKVLLVMCFPFIYQYGNGQTGHYCIPNARSRLISNIFLARRTLFIYYFPAGVNISGMSPVCTIRARPEYLLPPCGAVLPNSLPYNGLGQCVACVVFKISFCTF